MKKFNTVLVMMVMSLLFISAPDNAFAKKIKFPTKCIKSVKTALREVTVDSVDWRDYTGTINYIDKNGIPGTLLLDRLNTTKYQPYNSPLFIVVDENFSTYTGDIGIGLGYKPNSLRVFNNMPGHIFSDIIATKKECHIVYTGHPDAWYTQWDIKAKTTGPQGQVTKHARNSEFEGIVTKVVPDPTNGVVRVTVSTMVFVIDASSKVQVNGNPATMSDIAVGQKAAGKYNTATMIPWEIFLQR